MGMEIAVGNSWEWEWHIFTCKNYIGLEIIGHHELFASTYYCN